MASRSPNHHYCRNEASLTSFIIPVQDFDPRDRAWVQREAHRIGITMEEFVRRIIHQKRARAEGLAKPSDAFRHYFGPEHGVELLLPGRYGDRPVEFNDEKVA